ncbi:MAG: metallophosphoesterase [Promethearchaeota archaeon]
MAPQISDLHVGSGDFHEDRLDNALRFVDQRRPDVVVVTGDLTDKGRLAQFRLAKEKLSKLESSHRVVYVSGNHDTKNNGLIFFEQLFGPRRSVTVLEELDTIVVALRSPKQDVRDGEIGDEQLEWVIETFEDCPYENRVLALHHHLIAVPDGGRRKDVVADAGDLLALTQDFKVNLVLQGHQHVPHAWVIGPTTFLYSGTTCTEKLRYDEDPCFNLIEIDGPDLTVTTVSSIDLSETRLLVRRQGRTKFVRPRTYRIESLRASPVFKEEFWRFGPKHQPPRQ